MSEQFGWWREVDYIPQQDRVLKKGDKGPDISELQTLLRHAGYPIQPDGAFGTKTETAVRQYQKIQGMVADGRAGAKTLRNLREEPRDNKLLTQKDIEAAADELDVPVATIMAMNEVESSGSGFFLDGRPKILYERHIMARRLTTRKIDTRPLIAQYPNLVNTETGGYFGGEKEYDRLYQAQTINTEAALESCSWGQFQIMGYHATRLGYTSIGAFVSAMQQSEGEQLKAFVLFIQYDQELWDALGAKNWTRVARLYNGPGYAKHDPPYDRRLTNAYVKHNLGLKSIDGVV